jgi:hypothetical protein
MSGILPAVQRNARLSLGIADESRVIAVIRKASLEPQTTRRTMESRFAKKSGIANINPRKVSDEFYLLNSVSFGSSKICFVLAGADSVKSVFTSSAKTNARKRDLPAASTA